MSEKKEKWFYQENSDVFTHIIRPENNPGCIICSLGQDASGKAEANARRIVQCVNGWDELVEALENARLISGASYKSPIGMTRRSLFANMESIHKGIEQALSKAKGQDETEQSQD